MAGLSPAAYSMIADSFPPEKRARPLGVYVTGAIFGVGLALIISVYRNRKTLNLDELDILKG